MTGEDDVRPHPARPAIIRILAALAAGLAFALGVYVLIDAVQPRSGLVSFTFLLILPAVISAFVAYVADPWKERSFGAYIRVPLYLLGVIIVASLVILREGVICVLILSPLWMISGVTGTAIAYKLRRRQSKGTSTSYCITLFALPLVAMQVEPMIPLSSDEAVVSRSIVINASAATIWPLLKGIPDVQPAEGQWNLSQDVIGIPRPIGARLIGDGIGADRFANWGNHIDFRERIIEWQPERRIGWRFIFDDIAGWGFTDRHLMPDSPYFQVTKGGYTVEPLGPETTRITLDTSYRIKTPVNGYAGLWGELLLGDLENNLLALMKQRGERNRLEARRP